MVALLHPGVYVQEVAAGARAIEGVPTSTAVFVGETERGPAEPTKIRGPGDYARLFGGHERHAVAARLKLTMRYEVDLFFQNGGTAAYVLRTNANGTLPNTTFAGRTLNVAGATPSSYPNLIRAASPGEWANNVFAVVQHRGDFRFRVTVFYRRPGEANPIFVEDWDQLTLEPADANYVGAVLKRSSYVRWQPDDATPRPPASSRPDADVPSTENVPELERAADSPFVPPGDISLAGTKLGGAANDSTAAATATGLQPFLALLDPIDDAALLVGASSRWVNSAAEGFANDAAINTYYQALQGYTDNRPKQDLFYVADLPAFVNGSITDVRNFVLGLNASTFAGVYWPHLSVLDPVGLTPSSPILLPPSGAVAGIFARTDNRRGVWKAPAGVEATVSGILRLEREVLDGEQDDLNPIGGNVIRSIPGAGTVLWGSRTIVPTSEWRYVPVRRTAMFLRKSIFNGIQFAVFEPNDAGLWATLRATISAFMDTQFRNGVFAGSTAREAYFVKVDAETTTPDDQAQGVVNILVGFAPLRPAEFVVVSLSQKTATSA
jgi:phage tail sheath protein FI